ncbi:MAG: hypothetical protein HYT62_00395 [Candidatus Yanofskybacteria bacterium]|nr:hypothetical protein [Candidatus Yanofskybacteria bacterium]
MEKESQIISDNTIERRDRKMELMEERHRNAITAFRLEQYLSKEEPLNGEYPTSRTAENREKEMVALGKLKPILDRLEESGLLVKQEKVMSSIANYIKEKVRAQRAEQDLREIIEKGGKEATPQEVGSTLFMMRLGTRPEGYIEAARREGYFVIACFNDEDYRKLSEDSDKEESGGRFHEMMDFGDFEVDTLLIKGGWINSTFLHERQHFINASVFDDFAGFNQQAVHKKNYPLLSGASQDLNTRYEDQKSMQGLNLVKDEILARIRDGSSSERATDFFDSDLYGYLQDDFSPDEQREVRALLGSIETELKNTYNVFDHFLDFKAILVYHLVDIPLLKFPERIRAVTEFLDSKIKEFLKFLDIIPNEPVGASLADKEKRDHSRRLELSITGEVYSAIDLILGIKDIEVADMEKELESARKRITLLVKELASFKV